MFLSFCFATCAGWLYKCLTSVGLAQAQYFNKDWMNGFWIMFWRQPKHKSNSMIQSWQCYIYLLLLALPTFIICLPASLSEEMRSIDLHESFWRWKLTFITIILFDLCYTPLHWLKGVDIPHKVLTHIKESICTQRLYLLTVVWNYFIGKNFS